MHLTQLIIDCAGDNQMSLDRSTNKAPHFPHLSRYSINEY